jgi:hypothetical protein
MDNGDRSHGYARDRTARRTSVSVCNFSVARVQRDAHSKNPESWFLSDCMSSVCSVETDTRILSWSQSLDSKCGKQSNPSSFRVELRECEARTYQKKVNRRTRTRGSVRFQAGSAESTSQSISSQPCHSCATVLKLWCPHFAAHFPRGQLLVGIVISARADVFYCT